MELDKYQQAWEADSSHTRVTVDADVLLKKVRRYQQELRAAVSLGQLSDIWMSLLMLPVWIYMGVKLASPWTWCLMIPVFVWSIGFALVVRARQKRKPSEPSEPLLKSGKESLALVEHQIWWTRNHFWWSQLPTLIALMAFTANISWLKAKDWLDALTDANAFLFVLFPATFYFMYYINQRVVRTQYEPRRRELLALLASLDETTSDVSGEYPMLMSDKRVECSSRRMFVASLCFVAITLIVVVVIIYFVSRHAH
jgi:hypothetical protein